MLFRPTNTEVGATLQSDESAGQLSRQFMDLIRPGSCIDGQFGRVREHKHV